MHAAWMGNGASLDGLDWIIIKLLSSNAQSQLARAFTLFGVKSSPSWLTSCHDLDLVHRSCRPLSEKEREKKETFVPD